MHEIGRTHPCWKYLEWLRDTARDKMNALDNEIRCPSGGSPWANTASSAGLTTESSHIAIVGKRSDNPVQPGRRLSTGLSAERDGVAAGRTSLLSLRCIGQLGRCSLGRWPPDHAGESTPAEPRQPPPGRPRLPAAWSWLLESHRIFFRGSEDGGSRKPWLAIILDNYYPSRRRVLSFVEPEPRRIWHHRRSSARPTCSDQSAEATGGIRSPRSGTAPWP
jgi:hypothetical protein